MAFANDTHPKAPRAARPRRTHDASQAHLTHILQLRVYYEDTDAAGMVYHANYLKFAERGRSDMLRSLGFGHRRLAHESGVGFAVRRCSVEYLAPARLEDALTVETSLTEIGAATLELRQQVRRGSELLADLTIAVACIGRDGRPRRLPSGLRAALAGQRAP